MRHHLLTVSIGAALTVFAPALSAAPSPARIVETMEKAADWQLAQESRFRPDDWVNGAFYTGLLALADVSASPRFHDAMLAIAERNRWRLGSRTYFADDHCVGQAYAELYLKHREPRMIAPMRDQFDFILKHPKDDDLTFAAEERNPTSLPPNFDVLDKWSWCDSLFMAPPAWVRLWAATGERAYLDFAVAKWWVTSDLLYDREERIYFRDTRFFGRKEANGRKVFWARGNGWVMGGLVRVLQHLPKDHPARPRFETQFREMAERVIGLQREDGLWSSGLLDPASYTAKETSGSGFFCYAFAWGVNNGLLDRAKYELAIWRAWEALAACVQGDGKLIHVQPIGASPKQFPPDATEAYGVGALLLAGSEAYRLAGGTAPASPTAALGAGAAQRAQWCAYATKLASPILLALEKRQLKATMPVEAQDPKGRAQSTHLEALGRLLAGLAPWLELGDDGTPEGAERARLARLARTAIDAATSPESPDKMNFTEGRQPLVDAAFLAQAIQRAPRELGEKLEPRVRANLVAALKSTRAITPPENNWVLFAAMVEVALGRLGEPRDQARLLGAVERLQKWYLGDGVYGDGPEFHWDYYNAFVIHPMLLDILDAVGDETPELRQVGTEVRRRAQRYAVIQERLVAPDGSFPVVGRSIVYRAGALHCLAAVALRHELPVTVVPAQAREALARAIRRTLEAADTFDGGGWLRIGLAGHQPALAEPYISTGSLYLCATALLPLGLPATDPFWTGAPEPTTWEKAWGGADLAADHALKNAR